MAKTSRSILIILILISLSFLTACGSAKTETPAPSLSPPTQAAPPTSTTLPEPVSTTNPTAAEEATLPAVPAMPDVEEDALKLGLHATATGVRKYVVILADFPDVRRQVPVGKISSRALDFLSDYFREVSYQQLDMQGTITRRYTLPQPVRYYRISPHNLEVDRSKVVALVKDVVDAADNEVEFTEDLLVLIALGATHVEYGMVGYCAVPGMLNFSSSDPIQTKSGEVIYNAAVFTENAHPGTYIHDTLHMLGGIVDGQRMTPCLYDHDLQAKYAEPETWAKVVVNMGFWDPLSSHFPYERELPPTGLSSWTKMRLGWIPPEKIALVKPGETTTLLLDPLNVGEQGQAAETLVIKIPLSEHTYYLIENRQAVSADVNLPSSGVLVLYADDSVQECRHGEAPVKIMDANPDVEYMNDAAYDIGKQEVFIDAQNNLAIVLVKKEGLKYEVLITTPEEVEEE